MVREETGRRIRLSNVICSDSFPIPKANPAWTVSTYPQFLKGLNGYDVLFLGTPSNLSLSKRDEFLK